MNELKHVLVTLEMCEEKKQQLREAFGDQVKLSFFPRKDREAFIKGLETADALLLDGDIDDLVLTGKNLKWIHCDHSGLTYSARPEVFERGLLVTGSAGRTAPALSEHAILFMLALTYDLRNVMGQQEKHQWGGCRDISTAAVLSDTRLVSSAWDTQGVSWHVILRTWA